jgi:hypothetical protein
MRQNLALGGGYFLLAVVALLTARRAR